MTQTEHEREEQRRFEAEEAVRIVDETDPDRLDRLNRLLRGEQSASRPRELPTVAMAPVADLADTLDTLARAFRDGIVNPKTTLSHYAQGRADGLAWAAEQLRILLADPGNIAQACA